MKGKNTEKELKKAKRELSIETLIANNRYIHRYLYLTTNVTQH